MTLRLPCAVLAAAVIGCTPAAQPPMQLSSASTAGCASEPWAQFVEVCLHACEHCPGGDQVDGLCPWDSADVIECYPECVIRCEFYCEGECVALDCAAACGLEEV